MPTPGPRIEPPVVYPDADGQPMADNTEQFEFISATQGNLDALVPDLVAGDHLWYPVQGHPEIRRAPDVYVALGRPKGHRGSYKQWEEGGVPVAVVFEWWSPNSTFAKELLAHRFYEGYGVAELYTWSQVRREFSAFVRRGDQLEPVDTSEGWTSPLLGVRFVVEAERLRMFGPDGTPFRTFPELKADRDAQAAARAAAEAAQAAAEAALRAESDARSAAEAALVAEATVRYAAESRAAALEARLRALGIDPDAT